MIQIKLKPFSGPMELLLDLIEKQKIDIYDIEIASITEQFLQAMQHMTISATDLADFIHMGATLLMMKSRALLESQIGTEEEEAVWSREDLIARLVEYRKFRNAAAWLEKKALQAEAIHGKLPEDLTPFQQEETEEIVGDGSILHALMEAVTRRMRAVETDDFAIEKVLRTDAYNLSEYRAMLRERLHREKRFSIDELLTEAPTRGQVIIVFLSILEVTRTGEATLQQEAPHRPIWIHATGYAPTAQELQALEATS